MKAAARNIERLADLRYRPDPTVLRNDPKLRAFVESVVANLHDPVSPDFARSFVADTSSENLASELIDLLVDELLMVPASVWKEMFAGLLQYDDLTELASIEAPTLLLWGDADTLISREMQDHLARSISNAELVVYPGVGHTPRWDDPAHFSSDLVTFVHRV